MKPGWSDLKKLAVKGKSLLLVTVALLALALAACQPVMPEDTALPAGEETAAPSEEATETPAEEPTGEATEEATEEATMGPAEEAAVAQATQALADELQVSADTIEVVSTEEVEWPDGCLGVQSPDTMCAQVITPGYLIILSADGQEHEVHTNEDGTAVVIATERG